MDDDDDDDNNDDDDVSVSTGIRQSQRTRKVANSDY